MSRYHLPLRKYHGTNVLVMVTALVLVLVPVSAVILAVNKLLHGISSNSSNSGNSSNSSNSIKPLLP
jgi:hypothetical protein